MHQSKTFWLTISFTMAFLLSLLFMLNMTQYKKVVSRNQVDAFMQGVDYTYYNQAGQIDAHLSTPYVAHNQKDNTAHLNQPNALVYTKKRIPWRISADTGNTVNGTQVVHLVDHVKLYQPKYPRAPETTILTSKATFYPKKNMPKPISL